MQKGKIGITYKAYAAIAFVMAVLGWTTPLVLLVGVVMLLEKDEWAGQQGLQALFLVLFSSVLSYAVSILRGGVTFLNGGLAGEMLPFFRVTNVLYSIVDVLSFGCDVVIIIFALMGLANVLKGKDANVPLVGKFAKAAYGYVEQKVAQQPYSAPQGQPYGQQQPAQQQYTQGQEGQQGQQGQQAPAQPYSAPQQPYAQQSPQYQQPPTDGQPPFPPAGQ